MKIALLKNPVLWSVTIHAGIILPLWIGASAPNPQGDSPARIAVHFSASALKNNSASPNLSPQAQPVHREVDPSPVVAPPKDVVAKVEKNNAVEPKLVKPAPTVQPVAEVVENQVEPSQPEKASRPDPVQEAIEQSVPTESIQHEVQLVATLPSDLPDSAESNVNTQPRVQTPVTQVLRWSQSLETPVYPRLSRQRGEEGTVIVSAHVGHDGRPENIEIVQSSGYRNLNKAVVRALKKSTLDPSGTGEKRLKFTFRLQDDNE